MAAIGAVLFVIGLSGLFGFVVLPLARQHEDVGPLGAIERALGLPVTLPPSAQPELVAEAPASKLAWGVETLALIDAGDPERGRIVAEPCAACHGQTGISEVPQNPNLAAQDRAALFKQLYDFRAGSRVNEIMSPFAQPLSDTEIADVAAYFAAQSGPPPPSAFWPPRGPVADLVERGDPARSLPACTTCHGAGEGAGAPLGTPILAGQHPEYVATQLRLFASGQRASDIYGRMRVIAAKLTEPEIDAIAKYYATAR